MTKTLSSIFPNRAPVTREILKALDEQFRDLREKAEAGEYVVTGKHTKDEYEGVRYRLLGTYSVHGVDVKIKPAAGNNSAPIKSMTFRFGARSSSSDRTPLYFKIKTAEGKTLVYAQSVKTADYKFLETIRGLGEMAADKAAAPAPRKPARPAVFKQAVERARWRIKDLKTPAVKSNKL